LDKEILSLNARKDFKCLGEDCPRDCCHGWDWIDIDNNTVKKWKTESDQKNYEYLLQFLDSTDPKAPVIQYKDGSCIALNNNGLCDIQLKHGHDYLPEICREFPRLNFENPYRNYISASLACPDILESTLFSDSSELFDVTKKETDINYAGTEQELLYIFDILLSEVLDETDYKIGIQLFFISDMFSDLIKANNQNAISLHDLQGVRNDVSNYLAEIRKANKNGKISPNQVTSGSFWNTVYGYCKNSSIDTRFLEDETGELNRHINQSDNTPSGYGKIYSVVKKYKKNSHKHMKQKFDNIFRKYLKLLFINKGFPLSAKPSLDIILVDCMIVVSILQLLVWIEINKNGKIDDAFLKECITEVERKFVLSNTVITALEKDPHMLQIEKYCNTFLDIF